MTLLRLQRRNITSKIDQVATDGCSCLSEFFILIFSDYVLQISDGIEDMGKIRWQLALCLLMCWVIIFLVLIKGINSLGKVRSLAVRPKTLGSY